MQVINKFQQLYTFTKINEDFYNRNLSSGVITLVSPIVMVFLLFSEFCKFFISLFLISAIICPPPPPTIYMFWACAPISIPNFDM